MADILLIDKYWLAITLEDDRLKVNKIIFNYYFKIVIYGFF